MNQMHTCIYNFKELLRCSIPNQCHIEGTCKSAIFEVGGYVMFITIVNEAYVDYGHIESQWP